MVYILGIAQFLVIAIVSYYEYKLKSPAVFLWATLFMMFGVMHLITSLSGDFVYSDATLSQASMFVILFCLIYLAIRIVLRPLNGERYNVFNYGLLRTHCAVEKFPLLFFVAVLFLAIFFKLNAKILGSGGLLYTAWSWGQGGAYLSIRKVYPIIIFAFSGLALCAFLRGRNSVAIAILVSFALLVLISRNRIEVLPILVCVLTLYLFKTKKLDFRSMLVIVAFSLVVIYVVYGLRVFRHYGTLEAFLHNFRLDEFLATINLYIATDNGELGLRRVFYNFIEHTNNFDNFGKAHSYIRMLFVFIPTQWSLGIKPPDFAQSMGAAIGMMPGGSTHPTLFGDCYANLGWAGILLGGFWAAFATCGDYIILKRRRVNFMVLLYSLFAVGYVIIGRGSVYNGFVYVAYGVVIILILEFLSRLKIGHVKHKSRRNYVNQGWRV